MNVEYLVEPVPEALLAALAEVVHDHADGSAASQQTAGATYSSP
jgi:hypothetical protein